MSKKNEESSGHVQKSHIRVCTAEDLKRRKPDAQDMSHYRGSGGTGGSPFFEPKFSIKPSAKQIEKFANFLPSIVVFSITTALCTAYICEWKDVLQYLPYYRGKYKNEEDGY